MRIILSMLLLSVCYAGDCTQEFDECGSVINEYGCWAGCGAMGDIQYFSGNGGGCASPFCTFCGEGVISATCTSEMNPVCSDLVYNPDAYNAYTNCDCEGSSLDECGVCNGPGASHVCWHGAAVCDATYCTEGFPWGIVSLSFANVTENSIDILYYSSNPITLIQFAVNDVFLTDVINVLFDELAFNPSSGMLLGFMDLGSFIPAEVAY